jgi:uncharacterized protein (DUF736 family)
MAEKEKEIGALWEKQGSTGPYFTGSIEIDGKQIRIVAFKNGYKKADNQPDWRIFPQKFTGSAAPSRPELANPTPPPIEAEPVINYPEEDIDPNDIPF